MAHPARPHARERRNPGSAAACRPAESSSSAPTAAGSSGPASGSGRAWSTPQGRTARFADGSSLDVAVVVWATGYRSDYSWISIPGVTADGRVVHRRGVTDVPGLYFLGLSWQYTRGSALLGFVADDAAHVVRAVGMRSGQVPEPRAASAGNAPGRGGGARHRATDDGGPGRRTTDTARC